MGVPSRVIGRYALHGEIAAGGMATVHYGRLLGPVGFSRTVAIKRLHAQFAKDPEFVAMFLDEARIAARVRHANVVATLDVVVLKGELFVVMDYVQGESLAQLWKTAKKKKERIPPRIFASILCGALHGLHAAHEAKNERGEPLGIVHRDISPQNVLVGVDGTARVLDFGVAKASGRIQNTREGHLKGKIAYMAPEQIRGSVSRASDVYAAAIVAWEALTGKRLFACADEVSTMAKVIEARADPPSQVAPGVPDAFDAVILKGLAVDVADRYATAREMALALEKCAGVASPSEVGDWVESNAADTLSTRADKLHEIESSWSGNADAVLVAELTSKRAPAPPRSNDPDDLTLDAPPPALDAAKVPLDAAPAAAGSTAPLVDVTHSSISVARLPRDGRASRSSLWLVVAGVAVALALGVVFGRSTASAPASASTAPPAEDSASAAPSPSSAPEPTAIARRGRRRTRGADRDGERIGAGLAAERSGRRQADGASPHERSAFAAAPRRREGRCGELLAPVRDRRVGPQEIQTGVPVMMLRRAVALVVAAVAVAAPRVAQADDVKQACVAAAERSQQERDERHLTKAREDLIFCARDTCPALVKEDCVRWLLQLDASQPSIVVSAKDAKGQDAVSVRVTCDGAPLASSLDGRAVRVDPGVHVLRFEAEGGGVIEQKIVVREGEQNRAVSVDFAAQGPRAASVQATPPPASASRVPVGPLVLAGVGVAAVGVWAVVGATGTSKLSTLRSTCGVDASCDPSRPSTRRGRSSSSAT